MAKRITSLILTVIMLSGVFAFQTPVFANESCTIAFDANGGTGIGVPENITVDAGTIINLPAATPTKPGMVFMGWAFSQEQADVGDITYAAGTTPQILVNNSATLYASYAYSVVLNHGNRGWGNGAYQLYKYPGKDLDLFHKKDLIHANYGMLPGANGETTNLMVFMEWNTSQTYNGKGNGIGYHEKYTTNASTTLYCIWGNPISYNANGGTFPATGTDRQSKYVINWSLQIHDDTNFGLFDFPGEENSPTKPGCRLVTNDAGETVYARVFLNGNIYRLESKDTWLDMPIFNGPGYKWEDFYTYILPIDERALELYAIWEPSVTYKANGGEGSDIVEYMEHVGPTLFSYADYTILNNSFENDADFLGWNTKPDGSGESYSAGDVITGYNTSEPIILYAQWDTTSAHTKEYTVSFNAMEGYLPYEKQSYDIAYAESYADAFEHPVPARSGYLFKGWYNEETESYLNYDKEAYSLNHSTAFNAVWERHDNHYLETFRVDSTCITEGNYTASCYACNYYNTIVYDKVGHTFTDWNYTGDANNVKRYCSLCGCSEDNEIPPSVNQQIIAYINKSVAYKDVDFPYIDVLNYLGPAIDGGPGEYPFQQSYFGEAAYMRQVASAKNPNIKIVCTIFNRNIVKFEN
ncbi:MAG: InlB B-repeat-containing protein [Clostridia bacterium]|nr:InlB B-repeat-containing protein [Clostridia bacterium]